MNPEAVAQLARLCGQADFARALGLPGDERLPILAPGQFGRLRAHVDERLATIAAGLLREAMASDDIQTPKSADAYLEERLRFLSDLLSESQCATIRRLFQNESHTWQ